ncbi:phage tail protein [Rodentibacter pneumotropicus]|uniref:Phage tail protein n=1 Tax=Rodentibacter pneumotropicus TaxID=758 RepID=A0A4S2PSI0_9PAST|nr:phage tail protein [Rodentibacter pneumotropicus]NBH76376.1 phage tail protein [Rodentibacter pneumotropicus]THA06690.1 phage tail protein [Rodentibacter pneumotropicus]THA11548.1 phage tail protein [Rodentibacter pneumotropicus]THA14241.1 phage tail protein [Rodentibacter pneumotropicus]
MAAVKKMLYQQLTDFLLTKLPKRYHGKFYSWMENGKLVNQGRQVTDNGIEICHIQYDGILFFDEFPFKEISPAYLMALIQIWLNEHDYMRDILDNHETPFDIEIINDDVADMSFTISFQEPLTAIEDGNGELEIDGTRYTLSEIEIFTADEIDIEVEIDDPNKD